VEKNEGKNRITGEFAIPEETLKKMYGILKMYDGKDVITELEKAGMGKFEAQKTVEAVQTDGLQAAEIQSALYWDNTRVKMQEEKIGAEKKPESMECVKYNKVENDELETILQNAGVQIFSIEYLNDKITHGADEYLKKMSYADRKGDTTFVLERRKDKGAKDYDTEIWQFKKDFATKDADVFLKQWDDNEREKNKVRNQMVKKILLEEVVAGKKR